MSPKILVAGAGHGGLAAAYLLSKNGYDVTVYEKNAVSKVGYPWSDSINPSILEEIGMPPISKRACENTMGITYTNPNETVKIRMPDKKKSNTNYLVDRKKLLRHMIKSCRKAGVKFEFGVSAVSAFIENDRVSGLVLKKNGKYFVSAGDLVIDSAGADSPIRTNLPESFDIEGKFHGTDIFSVYRGLYEKLIGGEPENKYTVYFFHTRERGLDWVISEKKCMDVLIGRFREALSQEQIEKSFEDFRNIYPTLSDNLISGGTIQTIPVRRTIGKMIGNNIAIIGDSAAMAIPMLGSGVNNTLRAGKMLADAVMAVPDLKYCEETLWPYQYNYMKNIGNNMLVLDKVKNLCMTFSPDDIDYLLEHEILNEEMFSIGSDGVKNISPAYVIRKVLQVVPKLPMFNESMGTLFSITSMRRITGKMPETYDKEKVEIWRKAYREA